MNIKGLSLAEMLHADAERGRTASIVRRWEAGEEPDTLAALEEHPELQEDKSCVLDLVYEEYCLRADRGETIDADVYCARFPRFRSSVLRMLVSYQLLQDDPEVYEKAFPSRFPEAGETIGDLTLVRELGRGTFSHVFLAREASTGGRLVAVKFTSDGQHEAWTLGPLNHPNVVKVLSAGPEETTGLHVVRMPYHGPSTLDDLLNRAYPQEGAAPPRDAQLILETARADDAVEAGERPAPVLLGGSFEDGVVWLIGRMAAALAFLHERDICHRDLKPTNVLLNPAGQPLLLDFNLSADGRVPDARLGGTLPYMAPEQLRAMTNSALPCPGPEADVFALGVIAHELLTGRHPFGPIPRSTSSEELAERLLQRQHRGGSLFQSKERVQRPFTQLLARCLNADAAARPTAAELQTAAERHFTPVQPRSRLPRKSPAVLMAAILLFALVGVSWMSQATRTAPVPRESTNRMEAAAQFRCGRKYLVEKKEQARAYAAFQESNRLWPDGQSLACMAYLRALAGGHHEAIGLCDQAMTLGFKSPQLLNNRGYSTMMLGQRKREERDLPAVTLIYDAALFDFNEAIRLDPKLQASYSNRARLARRRHLADPTWALPDRAVEDVREACRLSAGNPRLLVEAARVCILASVRRDELKNEALQYLIQASAKGADLSSLGRDPLFHPLKDQPRFKQLVAAPKREVLSTPEPGLLDPIPASLP